MAEASARFEFRAWARSFPGVESQLRRACPHPEIRESDDLYVLARTTDNGNVKIRDNTLDIKLLIETRLGLEQWQPKAKYAFPVSAAAIAQNVCPALGVSAPNLQQPDYSEERFLDEVVQLNKDLASVNISKQRYSFTVDDCIVELANVGIHGARSQTVAIEAERPSAVLEVRHKLGLDTFENVSYVRWIKYVLGMTPLRSGS